MSQLIVRLKFFARFQQVPCHFVDKANQPRRMNFGFRQWPDLHPTMRPFPSGMAKTQTHDKWSYTSRQAPDP
jgi:hypothetical protein